MPHGDDKKPIQTSPMPNPRIHNQSLPTQINPNKLDQLLVSANYPADLTKNLLEGFKAGFSLVFREIGPAHCSQKISSINNKRK